MQHSKAAKARQGTSVRRAGGRGGGDLGDRPPGQAGAAAAQLEPSVVMGTNADLCCHSFR